MNETDLPGMEREFCFCEERYLGRSLEIKAFLQIFYISFALEEGISGAREPATYVLLLGGRTDIVEVARDSSLANLWFICLSDFRYIKKP